MIRICKALGGYVSVPLGLGLGMVLLAVGGERSGGRGAPQRPVQALAEGLRFTLDGHGPSAPGLTMAASWGAGTLQMPGVTTSPLHR